MHYLAVINYLKIGKLFNTSRNAYIVLFLQRENLSSLYYLTNKIKKCFNKSGKSQSRFLLHDQCSYLFITMCKAKMHLFLQRLLNMSYTEKRMQSLNYVLFDTLERQDNKETINVLAPPLAKPIKCF